MSAAPDTTEVKPRRPVGRRKSETAGIFKKYKRCEECGASASTCCRDMDDEPMERPCFGRRLKRDA